MDQLEDGVTDSSHPIQLCEPEQKTRSIFVCGCCKHDAKNRDERFREVFERIAAEFQTEIMDLKQISYNKQGGTRTESLCVNKIFMARRAGKVESGEIF